MTEKQQAKPTPRRGVKKRATFKMNPPNRVRSPNDPHPRKAKYHKLTEADHEVIIEGLSKFVPVYVIAQKIGCGYHPLLDYIKATPELEQVQEDASKNEIAFAKGKLFQKIGAGHAGSIMFFLERCDRAHFGRHVQIENIGDLPTIQIGKFDEADFVDPIDPSEVSKDGDAAEILDQAAIMAAKFRQAEDEAAGVEDGDE